MKSNFNIVKYTHERINEAILKDSCQRFINLLCDDLKISHLDVRETLIEELYKGSVTSVEGNKRIITFRFPRVKEGK